MVLDAVTAAHDFFDGFGICRGLFADAKKTGFCSITVQHVEHLRRHLRVRAVVKRQANFAARRGGAGSRVRLGPAASARPHAPPRSTRRDCRPARPTPTATRRVTPTSVMAPAACHHADSLMKGAGRQRWRAAAMLEWEMDVIVIKPPVRRAGWPLADGHFHQVPRLRAVRWRHRRIRICRDRATPAIA